MILYISGPMSGVEDHNRPAFYRAEEVLEDSGYEVMNPARWEDLATWELCLRRDLAGVVQCDGIAVLPFWYDSRGAKLEVHVADALSMPVKMVDRWLKIPENFR